MQTIVYQCDTAMPAQKLPNCWIRVANTYSFVNNRHLFSNAVTAGNKLG